MAVVVSSLPKLLKLTWWQQNFRSKNLRQESRNIAISHYIVPVWVGNSGSLTVNWEALHLYKMLRDVIIEKKFYYSKF